MKSNPHSQFKVTMKNLGHIPLFASLALALTSAAWADTQTFTTSGTWELPPGVTSVTVECRGGGGAAGTAKSTGTGARARSGGGAGGSYATSVIDLSSYTAGAVFNVTVGAGGVPVTDVAAHNAVSLGQKGGDSIFISPTPATELVKAVGGVGGGSALKSTTSVNASGGVGSAAGNLPLVGGVFFAGGNGGTGAGSGNTGGAGAGGGGAGDANPGGNAGTIASFGVGGAAGGGNGGTGRGAAGPANTVPSAPGGGGGGACADAAAINVGAVGARGEVKLTYTIVTGIDHFDVAASSPQTAGAAFDVTITAQGPAPTNATVDDSVTTVTMTSPAGSLMEFNWNGDETWGDNSGTLLNGVKTIKARNKRAETKTIVATSDTATTTAPPSVTIDPAAFAKLQILAPGETTASGTGTGKTGTPSAQSRTFPFNVTVNAVDEFWNPVSSTDNVGITSSDLAATLPANAPLGGGTGTFAVTLDTVGTATLTATDLEPLTTISSDTTPAITVQEIVLVWQGDGSANLWDASALNWLNPANAPATFSNGLFALFNNSSANLTVDITGTVEPGLTTVDSANNYTLGSTTGGLIGGAGGLTKSGAGTLTLTTANTYAGNTAINAGKLSAGNSSAFGSTGVVTLGNTGATLELANGFTIDRGLTVSNTGDKKTLALATGATSAIYSGAITNSETTAGNFEVSAETSGTLSLSGSVAGGNYVMGKVGDGTLVLSGTADNVGLIVNATAGEVRLGKDSSGLVHAVAGISGIANGATVKLTGTGGDQIFGGSAAANRGINGLAFGGTLDLNGLDESVSLLFGAGYSGGVVDGAVSGFLGTNTFTIGEADANSWFPGVIQNTTGTLNLVKVGTGTVTLIGANTYGGTTEIRNGALRLTTPTTPDSNRLPATTAVILGSGADSGSLWLGSANTASDPKPGTATSQTLTSLTTSGTGTTNRVIGGAGNVSTLTLNNASAVIYDGKFGGTGPNENSLALTKTGAGTFTFSGIGTYRGNTTVSEGTLVLAETGQLRFVLGATSGSNNSLTGAGTATINGDFVIDTTAADALSSGSWTLENVSTITGGAYGSGFQVLLNDGTTPWTDAGGDKWTKANGTKTYTFDETTGILTLVNDPFEAWAGVGVLFDADANGDGVKNGLAWLLGAANKDDNALGKLPVITQTGGDLKMVFDMLPAAARGNAQLFLEHSSDLGIGDLWTGVLVPDASGGSVSVTFSVSDSDLVNPINPLDVEATVSSSEAAAGRLFGRLRAEQ